MPLPFLPSQDGSICLSFASFNARAATFAISLRNAPGFSLFTTLIFLASISVPADATAITSTWDDTGFTDGNWNVAGNWSAGIPGLHSTLDTNNDTAIFSGTHNLVVTVDDMRAIGTINFSGAPGAFTLQGGALYLAISGSIYVQSSVANTETINTSVFLPSTGSAVASFSNDSTKSGANLVIGGAVNGRQSTGSTQTLILTGAGNGSITGAISDGTNGGKVAILKTGAGTWTLSGANSYTGSTDVAAGTLRLGASNALGSSTALTIGTANASASSSFDLNGKNQTIGSLLLIGTTTSSASNAVTLGGGTLTVNGTISTTADTTYTYTPSTISGAGALDLGGANQTFNVYNHHYTTGDLVISSIIQNGGIIKAQTGVLDLSAANTFLGDTSITGGTLLLGNSLALQNSTLNYAGQGGSVSFGTLTSATLGGLKGNQNLSLTNTNLAAVALTIGNNGQTTSYSGVLSGGGSIVKIGTGALAFSGQNTYSGGTTVNGGALLADNTAGSGTGTGAVTVNNAGSILGGTGIITGAVTVNGSAKLQGGDGTTAGGKLTLSGALTLNDNSIVQLALGSSLTHSSLTRSGGSWIFDNNQAFEFTNLGAQLGKYTGIVTGLSSNPGTENNWVITNSGWSGTFTYNNGNIDFTLTSVPEPGTWVAGAFAAAALGIAFMKKVCAGKADENEDFRQAAKIFAAKKYD